MSTKTHAVDIGIGVKERQELTESLSRMLADNAMLYQMTHAFHWNVTGPMFQTLHLMFETQYNELWLASDLLAERIRSLGFPAPGTYSEWVKLTSLKESPSTAPAKDMLRRLVEGHEAVARTARGVFGTADRLHDQVTCDLMTQRLQVHEKTAWMLRSLLEE